MALDNEDDDDGSGNQVVSATKKGAPSRTRHLPPLESDQSRSEYRMRATEKNADREVWTLVQVYRCVQGQHRDEC